jgi:hypothetical protein
MKIISGGQTGVDRAALDAAIARGMEWGGWCPKGGWAEDFPVAPGVLAAYPNLRETPLANPLQRTQWNVRDSDATLILTMADALAISVGTRRAHAWAHQHGKPELVLRLEDPRALGKAAGWLAAQKRRFGPQLALGIGGPRETEAPGIYAAASRLIATLLDVAGEPARRRGKS